MSGWALLIAAALLGANAFFVAAEFALMTARRTKLEQLANTGDARARVALRANQDLSFMLAGAQLGVTIASLGLGFVAEPAIAQGIETALGFAGLPESVLAGLSYSVALGIVVFCHMVFGEMVPKNIAIAAPETSARWLSAPLRLYSTIFGPLIRSLNFLANGVLRLLRVTPRDALAIAATADEFASMISDSRAEGVLDELEEELLSGALRFSVHTTASVMTRRDDVAAMPSSTTADEFEALVVATGHSRFPVYDDDLDHVTGYMHAKSLLDIPGEQRRSPLDRDLVRPLFAVRTTDHLRAVLLAMRRRRTHIALVADDAGRTAGLITLEDVLEQLVGPIRGEHDIAEQSDELK